MEAVHLKREAFEKLWSLCMKRKKFSALTLPPHLDSSNSCAVIKQLEMSVMMGQRKSHLHKSHSWRACTLPYTSHPNWEIKDICFNRKVLSHLCEGHCKGNSTAIYHRTEGHLVLCCQRKDRRLVWQHYLNPQHEWSPTSQRMEGASGKHLYRRLK